MEIAETATQNRVCVRRAGGEREYCPHYARCRRVEPTGVPLPCERLLAWERRGQPEPDRKGGAVTGRQREVEQLLAESWPEGQERITACEVAVLLGQTESSARRHLKRMVARGLVVEAGQRGKANLYALARDCQSTSERIEHRRKRRHDKCGR
jgi:DNA-binding transcriptional ArsR family regulator